MGCRLNYNSYGDSLIKVSRREDEHPHAGLHCRKGRFGYNFIQSPDRLLDGRIRAGRRLQEASIDDAIDFAAVRLKELKRKHSGAEFAVFISPRLTIEEIYLAQKFARIVLGTHQVTSFARLVNREWDCPEVVSTATYADLADAQGIVAVNANLADEHFVVDLLAKKAIRGGARLIYVGPGADRTARVADVLLECTDGAQPVALLSLLAESARRTGRDVSEIPGLADAFGGRTPEALAELRPWQFEH